MPWQPEQTAPTNNRRRAGQNREKTMGDMAHDAGGYEVDYDPYEEGLATGVWTMRNYGEIKVSDMTLRHLKGAVRVAERAAARANSTCDEQKWNAWVDLLESEIDSRKAIDPKKPAVRPASAPRGAMTEMKCHCGTQYEARAADIARGWGLSCSKRCAAIRRDFGRPPAKPVRTSRTEAQTEAQTAN